MKTNWNKLIAKAMKEATDEGPIIKCTLTDKEMHKEFDNGYAGVEGLPFTMWTEKNVYFPICYDGAEWVGLAPRNPCDTVCKHQGGG